MLSVSNLLCDRDAGNESPRYGYVDEPRHEPSPRPVVVWAVTKACNLPCAHCYAFSSAQPEPNELSSEEGYRLIEDLAEFRVPAVLLSGGEPLARPETPLFIAHAYRLGVNCTLSTNGLLIDEDMADDLAALGLAYVGISLDGTRERHDKLRGKSGAFDGTLAAIDRCRARGIKVGLRFTMHALNVDDLEAIFAICLHHDIQRLCLYHLAYAGRGGNMRKMNLTAARTRETVDKIFARTRRAHDEGNQLEVLTVGNHADAAYLLTHVEKTDPPRAECVRRRLQAAGGNQSGCHIAAIDPQGGVHYDQFSWHYDCGNIREAVQPNLGVRGRSEAVDPARPDALSSGAMPELPVS